MFEKLAKSVIDKTTEDIKDKLPTKSKQHMINFGAGALAAAVSSMVVAPFANVSDIQSVNKSDPKSIFYDKKFSEVGKLIYQSGISKAKLKQLGEAEYKNIIKLTKDSNNAEHFSKNLIEISKLDRYKNLKELPTLKRIWSGLKEFYAGQGSKTLKNIPQNAINLAIFAGVVNYMTQREKNKK